MIDISKINTLVKVVELEPIYSFDGRYKFHYRIEIYETSVKQYFSRVLRYEDFDIKPNPGPPEIATESVLVLDDTHDWTIKYYSSTEEALTDILTILNDRFKVYSIHT